MGDEDHVNGVVTEENGGAETEAAPEQTEAVPEKSEAPENGQAEEAPEKESVDINPEKPVEEPNKHVNTVANILHKVKEDSEMSSEQKIDTLSMLLTKFVAENGV